MKGWLKTSNCIVIVLVLLAIIRLWAIRPTSSALPALNLMPFGLALMSAQAPAHRMLARAAVVMNILWVVLYAAAMAWLVFFNAAAVLTTSISFVPIMVVGAFNARSLWTAAFRRSRD